MKKIINNKLYNTETAKLIDQFDNGLTYRDFYYFAEELYQKKTGEFFIVGDGGAATIYSKPAEGGGVVGDCCIVPITVDEAKDWVERHSTAEIYESLFGEVEE